MPYEFEPIYQASRENFSIKNKNSNEIIGGYNPLNWHSDDYNFKTTSKSFIFSLSSLSNRAIPILSYVSSKKEAITQCKTKGPCFGFQDLWIEYYRSQRSAVGISKQNSYEIGIIDKDIFEIEEYEQLYKELSKEKPIVFVFLNVITAFVMALVANSVFMTIG
ncbi:4217_t:CDS:2, partial [Gigaspora rosea]